MILSLRDMKENPVFKQLDALQSQMDNESMQDMGFTRSPYQLISFLIAYAGLNATDRQRVVTQLTSNDLISKEGLDALIENIDWAAILKRPDNSGLDFEFGVSVPDVAQVYTCIGTNCPQLLEPLKNEASVVRIEAADKVTFTTKVSQGVSWTKPFFNSMAYWSVEEFTLSEALHQVINDLKTDALWHNGVFSVQKGNLSRILLQIKSPEKDSGYAQDQKDKIVASGIYDAFKGLTDFYGIAVVDSVLVKLSNHATFSDVGATASQMQEVDWIDERAVPAEVITNTMITIDAPLHVYYQGADIMVRLGDKDSDSADKEQAKSPADYFVTIATVEENAGIRIYPAELLPSQVHCLNFNEPVVDVVPPLKPNQNNLTDAQQPPKSHINYAFLFKLGSAFSAVSSLTVFTVAALAIAGIISLSAPAIGAVIVTGVVLAAISYGLFRCAPTNPSAENDEIKHGALPAQ